MIWTSDKCGEHQTGDWLIKYEAGAWRIYLNHIDHWRGFATLKYAKWVVETISQDDLELMIPYKKPEVCVVVE